MNFEDKRNYPISKLSNTNSTEKLDDFEILSFSALLQKKNLLSIDSNWPKSKQLASINISTISSNSTFALDQILSKEFKSISTINFTTSKPGSKQQQVLAPKNSSVQFNIQI